MLSLLHCAIEHATLHSRRSCTTCHSTWNISFMHAPLHSRRSCTTCHSTWNISFMHAPLHYRHSCTPCHSLLHCAPPKCPSLGRGVPPKDHASRRGGNAHERKAPPPSAVAWAKPARAGHPCTAQRQGVRGHAQKGALHYAGRGTTRMSTFRYAPHAQSLHYAGRA